MMAERAVHLEQDFVNQIVGDKPEAWDLTGQIPLDLLRELGARGVLCAEVPAVYGGLGLPSQQNGELTAHVGSLCSSLRSIMTSQGMAAWAIQRFGRRDQRQNYLAGLTSGQLAAVAFSEPAAGSDLSATETKILPDGESVILDGQKMWVTGAHYADLIVVLGRYHDAAALVVVPSSADGVHIEPVPVLWAVVRPGMRRSAWTVSGSLRPVCSAAAVRLCLCCSPRRCPTAGCLSPGAVSASRGPV